MTQHLHSALADDEKPGTRMIPAAYKHTMIKPLVKTVGGAYGDACAFSKTMPNSPLPTVCHHLSITVVLALGHQGCPSYRILFVPNH